MNYKHYDKYTEDELLEKIKKEKYEHNNKNNIQNNYYENKISNDIDFEKIYIFKIELNYSSEITVISSHYNIDINNKTKTNLPLNDYTLISLDKINNNKKLLMNYIKGFYNIEINLIKGKGKINILDENNPKQYILDYIIQENLNLLVNLGENEKKEIKVEIDEEEIFIFYIRVILCGYNNNNLEEIKFQKNNFFNFIDISNNKNNKNIWPLNFYMKLNITSADKELNDNLPLKNINLNLLMIYHLLYKMALKITLTSKYI